MIKPFFFYDGDSGQTYTVTDIIEDGKHGVVLNPDDLDIMRMMGEGGVDPEAERERRHYANREDVVVMSDTMTRKINGLDP